MKTGYCMKCGEYGEVTRHHVYPKCHFGGHGMVRLLCRKCHNKIEKRIPKFQKMSKEWYLKINNQWLMEA